MQNITGLIPTVVDTESHGERAYDIYSLLLKERIVVVGGPIDDNVSNVTIAQLLYLSSQDNHRPIQMFIHSPGGVVYAGLAIYDAMQTIQAPIHTFAVGLTASMGTVLLAAGEQGHRYALAHATIHMHPAGGGAQGYTEDVRVAFREQERLQAQNFTLLAKHTGRAVDEIEQAFERDRHMQALEAKEFGLVDEILGDINDIVKISDGRIVVPDESS
jgi:ATP-dependent Clp protease, protease subunit